MALFVAKSGQLQTVKGIMNVQLQEIKNIFIKNRLTEGVDFKRYEWLCGRNGAYIDTNYIVSQTDHINCHYKYDGTLRNPDGLEQDIFCVQPTLQHFCRAYINSANYLTVQFFKHSNNWYTTNKTILDGNITDLHIEGQNYYFSVNGKSYNFPTNFETFNADRSIWLFNRDFSGNKYYFHGDIASFSIKDAINVDKVNMIPCQLLRSIPATLDANSIARSAGECGMYDSISGKFFGNVANTGTFTVEGDVESETHTGLQQIYQNKLIEGVDYQTYDWLKADIPISTSMMSLPINSKNFEFQRNWIQIMNSAYFETFSSNNRYSYFIHDYNNSSNRLQPAIWNHGNSVTAYRSLRELGLGIHTIIANNDEVTISSAVNTATLPWYGGTGVINIRFNNAGNENKNTIHLTSSIKVDGVIRYVPCTLLHSIPRNLDAQCKERVAGECGMIDLISGKFYGNVANSGTFTVENDNE